MNEARAAAIAARDGTLKTLTALNDQVCMLDTCATVEEAIHF